ATSSCSAWPRTSTLPADGPSTPTRVVRLCLRMGCPATGSRTCWQSTVSATTVPSMRSLRKGERDHGVQTSGSPTGAQEQGLHHLLPERVDRVHRGEEVLLAQGAHLHGPGRADGGVARGAR